jgi:hypothetical protein
VLAERPPLVPEVGDERLERMTGRPARGRPGPLRQGCRSSPPSSPPDPPHSSTSAGQPGAGGPRGPGSGGVRPESTRSAWSAESARSAGSARRTVSARWAGLAREDHGSRGRLIAWTPPAVRRISPASSRSSSAASRSAGGSSVAEASRPGVSICPSISTVSTARAGGSSPAHARVPGSRACLVACSGLEPATGSGLWHSRGGGELLEDVREAADQGGTVADQLVAAGCAGVPGGLQGERRCARPRGCRRRGAVERLPESSAASTTTTAADRAAMRRLRGEEVGRPGLAPGGCSLTRVPPPARTLANRPVLARG